MGVIVLGPKRSAESYAPDESDAIAHLAHGAGLAVDTLSLRSAERSDVFEAIRESNDRVITAIHELKASIERSPTNGLPEGHVQGGAPRGNAADAQTSKGPPL